MTMQMTLDGPQDPGEPTPAPAAAGPGQALVTLDGGRMNRWQQAWFAVSLLVRASRRKAKDTAGRDGSWVNHELATPPPSAAAQVAHLRARSWVPAGHEGGLADRWGAAFQVLVAIPGVAFGGWVAKTCASMWRFFITAAVVILFTAAVLVLFGHLLAAELVAGIPVGLTLAVALTVAVWPEPRDPWAEDDDKEEAQS